jgi:hypothetical protein
MFIRWTFNAVGLQVQVRGLAHWSVDIDQHTSSSVALTSLVANQELPN